MRSNADRDPSHLSELTVRVRQYTDSVGAGSPYATAISGVTILCSDPPKQPSQYMIKPALCITLQGVKAASFGSRTCEYRAGHGLVVTAEMPESGTVCAASRTEPYLGMVLELHLQVLQGLVEERAGEARTQSKVKAAGPFTLELNQQLIDCALRAVRLLDIPEAIPTLYPGIMREICYWLLKGPAGEQLHRIMRVANGQGRKMMRAVQHIRDRFREPIDIEGLAHAAGMSSTTFHRHFKIVTSMAPLQYQKQLRLFEARCLMISDHATVEGAAYAVGYASVSQFSREYTRAFGSPPRREVSAWKAPLSPHSS